MILDKESQYSTEQAVTAAAASTDYIDHGAARDLGINEGPLHVCVTVTETAASAGATTVQFQLQTDDNTSFSSAKTVAETIAVPKATLVAGHQFFIPLPVGMNERYSRVYYDVAVANLTAGKFSAAIVSGVQKNVSYPDAI